MTIRLAVIEVVVSDMAAALAFYRRLGLDFPTDADTHPHVEIDIGGVRLALDTIETILSFDADWTPPTGHRGALAFDCGTADVVDRTWHELVDAGHTGITEPWTAFWGQRYAVVHDPDGNQVDLFAALT